MSSNGSRSIQFYQGVFPFEQAQKERASNLFTLLEENDIFQNQTAQYSGLLRNDPQFYLVDTQGIYIKSSQRYIPIFLHDDQTSPTSNDSLKTIHKELMSCFSNRHIRKMTPRNSTKRELGKTASTTQRSHSLNTIPQRKPKEEQASESPSVQTAPAERAQNLQNQLDTATNEVAKLQEQLRESTRKIEFDGVTINAFLDRQEIDSDSLRKKQQEIIKLKKEIKNLQKRIHDLEQAQEAKAQEIQALQAQLAQAQADADERAQNLQNQLRTNEQNLTTKQEEIDRLSTRLENA
ncbi:MAG: hypothetical protein JW769_03785, partial [Parachlamydiales bacterium]|nr:hypothetical protein [Parachlamydiales bacterium]